MNQQTKAAQTPTAYDSAYPGSMHERTDGGFLRRDDAKSLAASLLVLVESADRAASDLLDENARLLALLADARGALEACERDADRYRWLRNQHDNNAGSGLYVADFNQYHTPALEKGLDAAIDARIDAAGVTK